MPWTSSLMELYAKAFGLESEHQTCHLSIISSSAENRETKSSFGLAERESDYKKLLSGVDDMDWNLTL